MACVFSVCYSCGLAVFGENPQLPEIVCRSDLAAVYERVFRDYKILIVPLKSAQSITVIAVHTRAVKPSVLWRRVAYSFILKAHTVVL